MTVGSRAAPCPRLAMPSGAPLTDDVVASRRRLRSWFAERGTPVVAGQGLGPRLVVRRSGDHKPMSLACARASRSAGQECKYVSFSFGVRGPSLAHGVISKVAAAELPAMPAGEGATPTIGTTRLPSSAGSSSSTTPDNNYGSVGHLWVYLGSCKGF